MKGCCYVTYCIHGGLLLVCPKPDSPTLHSYTSNSKIIWRERHVALPRIQRCHLLDYEHQLIPVVMSHCHYSQSAVQDQEITCNMAALERHILHRFIHGKPVIVADIPQVTYREKNVLAATTIADVRKKIPQVHISNNVSICPSVQYV